MEWGRRQGKVVSEVEIEIEAEVSKDETVGREAGNKKSSLPGKSAMISGFDQVSIDLCIAYHNLAYRAKQNRTE